jgi:hypothetical protein
MEIEGDQATFPAEVVVDFALSPPTPFGGSVEPSMTLQKGVGARVWWDTNVGRAWVEMEQPLEPVDVSGALKDLDLRIVGSVVSVSASVETLKDLAILVELVYYGLPLVLNLEFIDSPGFVRVTGTINGKAFQWGLEQAEGPIAVTTHEHQEALLGKSIERFDFVRALGHRRVVAALQYFRLSCRLQNAVSVPFEFTGERILNMAKTLEALFPGPEGETMDSVRAGLRSLGYPDDEIEAHFVPAIALRNKVDVGHALLSLLTQEDLQTLHEYTDRSTEQFRELLSRIVDEIAKGDLELSPYDVDDPKADVAKSSSACDKRMRRSGNGKGGSAPLDR